MKAEYTEVELKKLSPFEGNTRIHTEMQIKELRRSLKQFGQFRNIVIDESNVILAGHGIVTAMLADGWESAKAYRISGLSQKDKAKLLLADNKTQDMGREDFDAVEQLIKEIGDFDIPGYDESTLKALILDSEQVLEETTEYINSEYEETFARDRDMQEAQGEDGEGFMEMGDESDSQEVETFGAEPETIEGHKPHTRVRIQYNKKLVCPHCHGEVWV